MESKEDIFKIVPNPTSNLAKVMYSFGADEKGECIINDAVGVNVLHVKLNSNAKSLEFSTSTLTNGVYNYTILEEGKPICNGKFIVIK